MTLTVTAAEAIVADRITAVATTLRISERSARAYIDLDVLAEALVDSFAAEEPGAELLKLPRDAGLRVSGIGRRRWTTSGRSSRRTATPSTQNS